MIQLYNDTAYNYLRNTHGSGRGLKAREFDLIYLDPPFYTQRDFGEFDDTWATPKEYANMLNPILQQAYKRLSYNGSLILHLDWHASHWARVLMDEIFGWSNFQNEIIWKYSSGGASHKRLARKHDNLLWYTKDRKRFVYNLEREPYATPNVKGRPGFHDDGKLLTDVWDISIISTTGSERTGYPTQKPLALLERVIRLFSNPGDLVGDFFAGSGTTGEACANLGRDCILVDKSPVAIETSVKRFAEKGISYSLMK